MTIVELVKNLYEGSYEQDELVPYNALGVIDEAVPGCADIIGYINRAISIVSTWKFPNGTRIRFKANNGMRYVTTPDTGYQYLQNDPTGAASLAAGFVLAADAIAPTALHQVTLPAQFNRVEDYYKGWILAFPDNIRYFITSSDGATIYLENAIDIAYNNYPFMLHPTILSIGEYADNAIYLPEFISLASLYDRTNGAAVLRKEPSDNTDGAETTIGNPSSYELYGSDLYFDVALREQVTLRVRYWKYPAPIVTVNDRIELPRAFHDAIYLCAKTDLLRRIGEATEAYASWRSLEELMITLRSELDFEQEAGDSRLYPED